VTNVLKFLHQFVYIFCNRGTPIQKKTGVLVVGFTIENAVLVPFAVPFRVLINNRSLCVVLELLLLMGETNSSHANKMGS